MADMKRARAREGHRRVGPIPGSPHQARTVSGQLDHRVHNKTRIAVTGQLMTTKKAAGAPVRAVQNNPEATVVQKMAMMAHYFQAAGGVRTAPIRVCANGQISGFRRSMENPL